MIEMFPDGGVSTRLYLKFLTDDVIQVLDLTSGDFRLSLQTSRDGEQDEATM
tara:strand:+ start:618 stop:773 length:156 start_codon:yes stop_codon:yes gene_type:complete